MKLVELAGPGERLSVLCIGAHSDDIEIGAGATILGWIGRGVRLDVHWVVLSAYGPRADEARASAEAFLADAARSVIELAEFKDGFFPYQGADIKIWFEALKQRMSPDVILCHSRDTHVSCLLNRILPRTAVISAVLSYRNCLVGLRAIRSAHDSSTGLPQTIECPDATSGTSSWKFDARRWSRGGPRAITQTGRQLLLAMPVWLCARS